MVGYAIAIVQDLQLLAISDDPICVPANTYALDTYAHIPASSVQMRSWSSARSESKPLISAGVLGPFRSRGKKQSKWNQTGCAQMEAGKERSVRGRVIDVG